MLFTTATCIPHTSSTLTPNLANPGEVTAAFADINYMQEMTPEICKTAKVGDTGQLEDTRDHKIYWIAKLADLNCWMTQNLDYDDPGATGKFTGTTPSGWTDTTASYRAYWDPGEKVLSGSSLVAATSTTDKHLLVGNYYSWQSATNGTGSSATTNGATASGSICPGQWKLPIGNNSNDGSFGYLLKQYGVDSAPSNGSNSISGNPLYFQSGGYVISGYLNSAGREGWYWSSTAKDSGNAYILYFDSTGVSPSSSSVRYRGLSVRCLVQGS